MTADPLRAPDTDEEPWDLTEGSVVYTARWLYATCAVLVAFIAVLIAWRIARA